METNEEPESDRGDGTGSAVKRPPCHNLKNDTQLDDPVLGVRRQDTPIVMLASSVPPLPSETVTVTTYGMTAGNVTSITVLLAVVLFSNRPLGTTQLNVSGSPSASEESLASSLTIV